MVTGTFENLNYHDFLDNADETVFKVLVLLQCVLNLRVEANPKVEMRNEGQGPRLLVYREDPPGELSERVRGLLLTENITASWSFHDQDREVILGREVNAKLVRRMWEEWFSSREWCHKTV